MATIKPFRAQRFSPEAGELAHLVAPPYDVISSAGREELALQSPYNTVWLTLPESESDDRSKFVKYGRSSSRLSSWRQDGKLIVEDRPCLYRYRQRFTDPVSGKRLTRESVICLIKVEPYENGVVLPHEQTFPKHKEDRLRLLEATRTHLECIYGLFEDTNANVGTAIGGAKFEVVANITTEDDIDHELARASDAGSIESIERALSSERVWIADGHHRYETALAFRQSVGEHPGEVPEDYMMIALSSMDDPGLILLPTHRIIRNFPIAGDILEEKLQGRFHTTEVANSQLASELRSLEPGSAHAFGIALKGGRGLIATIDDGPHIQEWVKGEGSNLLKKLDVTILHDVILGETFGITDPNRIEFTRDAAEAVAASETEPNTVSFLMNPPSISDMRLIALGGEKMPQKSTYYYPKLLSGLVFWSMTDLA